MEEIYLLNTGHTIESIYKEGLILLQGQENELGVHLF